MKNEWVIWDKRWWIKWMSMGDEKMKKEWVWDKRRWQKEWVWDMRRWKKKLWKAYWGLTISQKFECLGLKFTVFSLSCLNLLNFTRDIRFPKRSI